MVVPAWQDGEKLLASINSTSVILGAIYDLLLTSEDRHNVCTRLLFCIRCCLAFIEPALMFLMIKMAELASHLASGLIFISVMACRTTCSLTPTVT